MDQNETIETHVCVWHFLFLDNFSKIKNLKFTSAHDISVYRTVEIFVKYI